MITIPTGAFTTLLGNVTPFASPHEDMRDYNVIRLNWDGTRLSAAASDTMRIVRDIWHPKEFEGNKDTLFGIYGGADEYWTMFVSLADAQELIKHFKLPAKEWNTPLDLDYHRGDLTISRKDQFGRPDFKAVVQTHNVEFLRVDDILDAPPEKEAVVVTAFDPDQLGAFCAVHADGPVAFTYCGTDRSTWIRRGPWFVGTIRPVTAAENTQTMLIEAGASA